nr:hypothetical protein [Tanacetum cinerariifolium]
MMKIKFVFNFRRCGGGVAKILLNFAKQLRIICRSLIKGHRALEWVTKDEKKGCEATKVNADTTADERMRPQLDCKSSGKSFVLGDTRIGEQNDELDDFDKKIPKSHREMQ